MKKIFYLITFIFLLCLIDVKATLLLNITTGYDNAQYASTVGTHAIGETFKINFSGATNYTIYNITIPLSRNYGTWSSGTYIQYKIYLTNASHQPIGSNIGNCNITGFNPSTLIPSTNYLTPTLVNANCSTPPTLLNNTEYAVIITADGEDTHLAISFINAYGSTRYILTCTTTTSCNIYASTSAFTMYIYGLNETIIFPNITYTITNNASQNNISTSKLNLTIESKINSSVNISVNTTSYLYYKINTTLNNGCAIFEQNICVNNGSYNSINMSYINNSHFIKTLYDNILFPAYYPFNFNYIDNTPHSNYTLYSGNNILFNVTNFSTSLNYTLNLEFNAQNKTSVVSSLLIYYCNSSYISNVGNPSLRNSCELIDSFSAENYNHLHNNSKHHIVPVVISNVTKTQQSYFIFVGFSNILNGWNVEYVTNSSYNNASFREGNFNAFDLAVTQTNKIFDMHLHPFAATSSDFFSYYTIFNDNGIETTSSTNTLYYGISFNKVSASDFLIPFCNGSISSVIQYTLGSISNIPVKWTIATSQSGTTINYNLSITDSLGNDLYAVYYGLDTNYTINSSMWNSLLIANDYKLKIYSTDSLGTDNGLLQCLFNICENNYQPTINPCISNTQLLSYYDANNCNEQILASFPTDNNTYISCVIPATQGETNLTNAIYSIALMLFVLAMIFIKRRSEKND